MAHNLAGAEVAAAPAFSGLHPGSTVLFSNVDDRVRLAVDGETVFAYDHASGSPGDPGFHNAPRLGVVDGALELRAVSVLRDVHYTAAGDHGTQPGGVLTPCRVGPGQVFLLGDDSARSRDSRHFGPVPVERLLGRPVFCYGPAARLGRRAADGTAP
ncbi:MAG: S26 family signal peptidase [Planctomycetes bacterium]|nr:S26 family signal peptidase [Planctomycetota bacterium]